MDFTDNKDLLRVLVAVMIPVLYGFFSEFFKKKKNRSHSTAKPPQPTRQKPLRHILKCADSVQAVKPSEPQPVFEEGQRVTADTTENIETISTNNYNELTKEELRRAVIWSEILTPKFKQY